MPGAGRSSEVFRSEGTYTRRAQGFRTACTYVSSQVYGDRFGNLRSLHLAEAVSIRSFKLWGTRSILKKRTFGGPEELLIKPYLYVTEAR
jgi:hypothetical protein